MKINLFRIPKKNIHQLKEKLRKLEMTDRYREERGGWSCVFYLSSRPNIDDISWVKDYQSVVQNLSEVSNVVYYAIYLCERDDHCFALTYGKSHFFVRKFCDSDFGLEMAKRIANEADVKQKASKRFSGRKKKEIKSFIKNTTLNSESGESVDYISASIIHDKQPDFGEKSKFGASLIISRDDLIVDKIPQALDAVVSVLTNEQARFELPKTVEVTDPAKIDSYNSSLRAQIDTDLSSIETEDDSYDLVGTDFVFYANERYVFHFRRKKSAQLSELSHTALKSFIDEFEIKSEDIFNIKIDITNDSRKKYSKSLYEMIEYMVPGENVVLEGGKWKQFNKEYLEQINESVDAIAVVPTEPEFLNISLNEPDFNRSNEVRMAGYQSDDTDFSKIKIGKGHVIEAWDLRKKDTVYAVKFGKPQKLVYVCSQAMATLDIIRNNANLKKLDNHPSRYGIWLGLERKMPNKISDINSIILKQHIDMFARKCMEVGMTPVLKLSQKGNNNT